MDALHLKFDGKNIDRQHLRPPVSLLETIEKENFDGLLKSGNISLIKKLHYTVLQTTAKH